jgi:hypothetical protein
MQKITVKHQLLANVNFYPNWPIKYLFLGTFNPSGGDSVNYFYGRIKNQTWPTLSKIFNRKLDVKSIDFIQNLQELGIACMDLIKTVQIDKDCLNNVIGTGYKDSIIINKQCIRTYSTTEILDVINNNPGVKIYSTWGKGSNLQEWKNEVSKINNIISLVSPSLAARVPKGATKIDHIYNDWNKQIKR